MTEATALPVVQPPQPHEIFRRRASRLRELSHGHTLAPFLVMLSRLVELQDRIWPRHVAALPTPLTASDLPKEMFEETLQQLLELAGDLALEEGPERARLHLLMATADARLSLAELVFRGEFGVIDAGACLYVALALQACLTPVAAHQLPDTGHSSLGRTCPCCGSKPLASVISAGPAVGSRYCCCALCGTLWPYLRATCTSCGDPSTISYCFVEGKADDVSAECCDSCGTTIKHFRQDRQPGVEPVADDIASLDLDLVMRETRYVRKMPNPLLLLGNP